MKICFLSLYLLIVICNSRLLAQNNEGIALQSLEFLNSQFHLNLKKMNEPVLILFDNEMYVCNEYVDKKTLPPLSRLRFQYEFKKAGDKYEFVLKVVSEFRGTFEVIEEENGNYTFRNLTYIKRFH